MRYRNDTGSAVLFPGLGLEVPPGGEVILPDDATAPGGFTPFHDDSTTKTPRKATKNPDPAPAQVAADTTPTEG